MACALENDAISSQSSKTNLKLFEEFTNHEELEDYVKNLEFRSATY